MENDYYEYRGKIKYTENTEIPCNRDLIMRE